MGMLSGCLQVSIALYLIAKGNRQLCFELSEVFCVPSSLQAVSNHFSILSVCLLLASFLTLQIK